MKKYLILFSVILFCFIFVGCNAEKVPEIDSNKSTTSNQDTAQKGDTKINGGEQNCFNAEVLAVYSGSIKVKCSDVTKGGISEGAEVEVTKNVVSAKGVPDIKVGDTVRVVYNGVKETYPLKLDTVFAVYLVDDSGNVIP